METLEQIWKRLKDSGYETDKGSIHSYIPVYEKLLAPYRETALNVLEIGLFNGNSMRMWTEYFTQAEIYGIDCSIEPHGGLGDLRPLMKDISNNILHNCWVHILDAENKDEVAERFTGIKFDVIIEDAGHEINQQLNLYSIWKNYLAYEGIYIIEDVQDIVAEHRKFEDLDECEIIDLRYKKDRYDDVLIVLR